jgi:hypothetical protein
VASTGAAEALFITFIVAFGGPVGEIVSDGSEPRSQFSSRFDDDRIHLTASVVFSGSIGGIV